MSEKYSPSLLTEYTREILACRLEGGNAQSVPQPADEAAFASTVRTWQRSRKPRLLLLGLGSGVLAGRLAALSEGLIVSETSPDLVRTLLEQDLLGWWRDGRGLLLADTSPWAHLLLLARIGIGPDNTCVLVNPELSQVTPEGGGSAFTLARAFQRLFMAAAREQASRIPEPIPRLTVAAILHPDEPGLDEFFGHIPAWVDGVTVVWDGRLPAHPPATSVRLTSAVRSLDRDFAAQRNAMLQACDGEFVLVLDGDERIETRTWEILPLLMARDVEAWWFPRQTLCPDHASIRVGYGLWPDLQLRLFRRRQGLAYVRPVHERLTGLDGPAGLLLDHPLAHLSHLRKTGRQLQDKLDLFSLASGGTISHRLNVTYPCLPAALFTPQEGPGEPPAFLRLRHNPA